MIWCDASRSMPRGFGIAMMFLGADVEQSETLEATSFEKKKKKRTFSLSCCRGARVLLPVVHTSLVVAVLSCPAASSSSTQSSRVCQPSFSHR